MLTPHPSSLFGRAHRAIPALTLAVALLATAIGPPAQVGAAPKPPIGPGPAPVNAPPPPPTPADRLQVVLHQVHVNDDREAIGQGEMLLTARFWYCSGPAGGPCSASADRPAALLAEWQDSFDAGSGDTVSLERVMPLTPDIKDPGAVSEATGFPVYPGQRYLFTLSIFERDPVGGDSMGGVQQAIDESNGWGINTYSAQPAGPPADTSLPPQPDDGLCAGCGGVKADDFDVTYEIRSTPLPDLHPTSVQVPGRREVGSHEVCIGVENLGQKAAGAFEVNLAIDGVPAPTGVAGAASLDAGASDSYCVKVDILGVGVHQLLANVDPRNHVLERDESNNQLQQTYFISPTGPVTGLGSPPAAVNAPITQPDLTVTFEVLSRGLPVGGPCQGQDPNRATAQVTNAGDGPAGAFTVRLVIDDQVNAPTDVSVAGLDPGAQTTVIFQNPDLSPGTHTLAVTVDPDNAAAESDETNNQARTTASCSEPPQPTPTLAPTLKPMTLREAPRDLR